jgi:glycosyltransferase involved in cell wall biosynthesis
VRILHVVKKYPPLIGGDATAVASLVRVQERAGHEAFVVTSNAPGVPRSARVFPVGPVQNGMDLDRITFRRLRAMRAVRRWSRTEIPRIRPDVVHVHAPDLGAPAAAVAHGLGIPVVDTCHGLWFPVLSAWSLRGRAEIALLRRGRYEVISTVDRAAGASLRARGFQHVAHVPNGVDADEFAGPRTEADPFCFLFAGRHEPQKGLDTLLVASALLRDRGASFRVVLLGEGTRTPDLRRQAHNLALDGVVTFAGRLPERQAVVREYLCAGAFVLPSVFEGFPITILEAWAAGLPVIATRVGGVVDVCTEGNALLVSPRDPPALARAMAALLEDAGLRRRLGDAGRVLVRDRYTWDAVAVRYAGLYAEAAARTRP